MSLFITRVLSSKSISSNRLTLYFLFSFFATLRRQLPFSKRCCNRQSPLKTIPCGWKTEPKKNKKKKLKPIARLKLNIPMIFQPPKQQPKCARVKRLFPQVLSYSTGPFVAKVTGSRTSAGQSASNGVTYAAVSPNELACTVWLKAARRTTPPSPWRREATSENSFPLFLERHFFSCSVLFSGRLEHRKWNIYYFAGGSLFFFFFWLFCFFYFFLLLLSLTLPLLSRAFGCFGGLRANRVLLATVF